MNFELLRNFGRAFGGALAGLMAKLSFDYAANAYGFWQAAALSAGTFVFTVAALMFFYAILQRSHTWRRLTNRNARYEGFWLQRVYNKRPYSISQISFDSDTGKWIYSGAGFVFDEASRKFVVGATWHSQSIHFDEVSRRWFFSGTAKLLDPMRTAPNNTIAEGRVLTNLDLSVKQGDTVCGIITDDIANGATDVDNVMAFYMRMFQIPDKIVGYDSQNVRLEDLRESEVVDIMTRCYDHNRERLKELS